MISLVGDRIPERQKLAEKCMAKKQAGSTARYVHLPFFAIHFFAIILSGLRLKAGTVVSVLSERSVVLRFHFYEVTFFSSLFPVGIG
jgi:hypothetical protein